MMSAVTQDDADDTFAPDQLAVGALSSMERERILREGSRLLADVLHTRGDVVRWRRYLRVVNHWRPCTACGLWTERKPREPCKSCGARTVDGLPAESSHAPKDGRTA